MATSVVDGNSHCAGCPALSDRSFQQPSVKCTIRNAYTCNTQRVKNDGVLACNDKRQNLEPIKKSHGYLRTLAKIGWRDGRYARAHRVPVTVVTVVVVSGSCDLIVGMSDSKSDGSLSHRRVDLFVRCCPLMASLFNLL